MTEKRRPTHLRPITPPSPQREVREGGKVVIDWHAYFLEFVRVHGEPVEYNGRLIFRDGWSYSLTDYEGPEWGPPAGLVEMDQLIVRYWLIRKAQCTRLLAALQHELQRLKDVRDTHSLPIQQVTTVEEGEGTRRRTYRKLDLTPLQGKIDWVRQDVEECEMRLKEIEDYYKKGRTG